MVHVMLDCLTDWLKGYLRAGKVLQLMEKYDVALGIYEYGLRNVPPKDPHRKVRISLGISG